VAYTSIIGIGFLLVLYYERHNLAEAYIYDARHSNWSVAVADSRDKMIQSAASLMGQRGMNATSFSDVLADSGAPRGSIYHHFPEGKRQLTECAMRLTSDQVLAHLRTSTATTAHGVLRHFMALFRQVVVASEGVAGCAIAGATIDIASDEDDLLVVARDAFQSWVALLAAQLASTGVSASKAHGVAVISIASVEGGLILCRAEGGDEPLRVVEEELLALVPDSAAPEGGDPACWAGLLCDECGIVLTDGPHRPACRANL
jgi:TetR/AcrR family transcriptional regulator, lmrAB and yxaGH operons repressor